MVRKSFENPSVAGFFVTICDLFVTYLRPICVYFHTSLKYSTDLLILVAVEQIFIRRTFASGGYYFTYNFWKQLNVAYAY
jgi:hypothetical protein